MEASILKEYRKRWQMVAEIEETEQQMASLALRWRQLNSIVQMALALGLLNADNEEEVEAIRYRWNKLREAYIHAS